MSGLHYTHVDVFSPTPYTGNSLAVFHDARGLDGRAMLRITQELRHFESVFLEPTDAPGTYRVRVFDLLEELPFAGHPIIGAGAALHHLSSHAYEQTWRFELPSKAVTVNTRSTERGYVSVLDQGSAQFGQRIGNGDRFAHAFSLGSNDLHDTLPLEVVSTGLAYLIVPVKPGALERARIQNDLTSMLHEVDAQYAVILDESAVEARHWTNDGAIEDVATGSAAGTIGAYRLRHGLTPSGETFQLHQGRFTGRPSVLNVQPTGTSDHVESVKVGGDVAIVGHGTLDALP